MQQSEIMIDGGMPMLDGTWYNPSTGDSLTIRDTVFEDNNLIAVTTDGRRLSYNTLSKYVKSDKPIGKKPKISPSQPKKKSIQENALTEPATWDDLMTEEDKNMLNMPISEINPAPIKKKEPEKSVEDQILEKALKRWDDTIKLNISLEWGAKKNVIENLIDMFAFTEEDLAKYLLSKTKDIDLTPALEQAVKELLA